ncbi:GDSL-type esterase/lipase family protein [Reichenbachiella versicolor]|uniref:GDSL-type esterase/lipase family protein n=1 Tax=Reichenbachiella versicolor TaxID=1821036 RepID=UPI000D6E4EAA|nr:GDSL-type esterase/lipase family protein [Reichenbachiella versicolor]
MYAKVHYVYFLKQGELAYLLRDEISNEETLLYTVSREDTAVGWNCLIPPKRYACDVVVNSEEAVLLKMPVEDFLEEMDDKILRTIGDNLYHQLDLSLRKQTALLSPKVQHNAVEMDSYFISEESTLEERVKLLSSSPFFGEFQEEDIVSLAELMHMRRYEAGDLIHDQDDYAHGINILIEGDVSLRRVEDDVFLDLRSISTPGYIFGWSSALGVKDVCRARAERKTLIYHIREKDLHRLVSGTEFGIAFYKMLIWLLGNQLELSHSRYIYLLDEYDIVSVKHIIDINRPKLPLSSILHQIPHLLKETATKPSAFKALHKLSHDGTIHERHIASICLDLLKSEEYETQFLEKIGEVYTAVAESTPDKAKENRVICAEKTKEVFKKTNIQLDGFENLPDEGGNIFIYNHLLNDSYYTLPNLFQLTLDSHFLSSVLYEKYGDPGMRTVRFGKSIEYGHQDYYENLGFITVFTKDSDMHDGHVRSKAKEAFYEKAVNWIKDGGNMVISPEGTSYSTEQSPGPFKMGPFNVADRSGIDPNIVPVVFCNFDKRISDVKLYSKILKPFKLSERVKAGQSLKEFVLEYQKEFAEEVEKAKKYSNQLMLDEYVKNIKLPESPDIWTDEIEQLKKKILSISQPEDLTVFFGSSSIRLWANMERDLAPNRVLNLGFGGSTYLWCSYYFKEVFEHVKPKQIILYGGDNDLSHVPNPREVIANLQLLIDQIDQRFGDITVAIMTVKPSPDRIYLMEEIREFNRRLSEIVAKRPNTNLIDIHPAMLDPEGNTRPELFIEDMLHMNQSGYDIWANILKEYLASF